MHKAQLLAEEIKRAEDICEQKKEEIERICREGFPQSRKLIALKKGCGGMHDTDDSLTPSNIVSMPLFARLSLPQVQCSLFYDSGRATLTWEWGLLRNKSGSLRVRLCI